MKFFGLFIMSILLFSMVSCSTGEKEEDVDLSSEEMDDEYVVDADEEDLMEEGEELGDDEEVLADADEEFEEDVTEFVEEESGALGSETGSYAVKQNDTLMLIAFKLYGDYGRWREIQNENGGIGPSGLAAGQILRYRKPVNGFQWNPSGNPYLIKRGDTLGTISQSVYGKVERWRDIYNNNRQMIKDPNLIFAGFTLYYIPDGELASL